MCGIGGFWGTFDRGLLERMNNAVAHRGPDDAGEFFDAKLGLGLAHRRLSIIDLSDAGHQPMWDSSKSVCIVYNGELYNYRELKEELAEQGFRFRSDSDTEVLLNLYRRDGAEMLSALNGIFAFALWDPQRGELLVARDGLGIKPLYYAQTDHGFLFSSELKAILQSPVVSRELDPQAIQYHLTYLWCPAPHTMLRAVRKLEPGEAMLVRDGAVARRWVFYDLPYQAPPDEIDVDEAVDRVRNGLEQAVRRQLVADVNVGAFLSGGLDSSSIVAMYRKLQPDRNIQCFTIGFTGEQTGDFEGFAQDLPYAERVAEHLGVDLHRIDVGPDMIERLPEMIYLLDEPQADPAPINALFISELARQKGIKVLLSGAGGDDIFTGYRRHYALTLERMWRWLPAGVRSTMSAAARTVPAANPLARRARKAFEYAGLDDDARLISYFYWLNPEVSDGLYSDHFRTVLGGSRPKAPLARSLARIPRETDPLNRMLYLEAKHFLADHNLNYTDKMSMATGVEVRVPLLDPDLIGVATSLPVRYKQRGRTGKWIFKKAMEPYLPEEVVYRPKSGFGAPLRGWLRSDLRPLLDELLGEQSLKRRGIFDPEAVRHLVDLDAQRQIDASYPIFSLMCIELWCRTFVDRDRPAPVDVQL
ncbi:asparagine synthase (glutamine-hydrolyzing) [Persicimonas caeni]|uniref:asparagine synthase (glutamine-hydrolyzing) n=1 Tax=Persicimonas caeni TaxID=2292766 RepID=A0A4Y6PUI5_PERCE|nr:asparagine synthase (glutamine-hydrolyzing) [Persicimonas caeni]QDG51677.1 asparagine synthase (glutamine-hydrolyzing) [Persicimonas caeni]QED32898.1 asparagine synthase (glutamine-hydrolyzing) [Persicimonas caeni]